LKALRAGPFGAILQAQPQEEGDAMLISQVLKEKGDMVFTASPGESVAAVAALLFARRVGAMVVLDDGGEVAGIVSERDIVRVVAEQGADGLSQPVSACMTREVVFAAPGESVDELLGRMTDRRVRHLPVVKGGRLVGIVSIGDLVKRKIEETVAEAESLKAYISA
jgi:CBS domain-containing protein